MTGRNLLRNSNFTQDMSYWLNYQYYESNGSAKVVNETDRFAYQIFDRKYRRGGSVGSLNTQDVYQLHPQDTGRKAATLMVSGIVYEKKTTATNRTGNER